MAAKTVFMRGLVFGPHVLITRFVKLVSNLPCCCCSDMVNDDLSALNALLRVVPRSMRFGG